MVHDAPTMTDRLFHSADASVRFARFCLEPAGSEASGLLRAKSTFVDPQGRIMHWHDFGDLEGPGWAANAVGGAHLLYRWGQYRGDADLREAALRLVDHVLEDGFVRSDGFIWPYWDLARDRFCLNYDHTDDWLCPGSLAKVGLQMLDLADALEASEDNHADGRISALRRAAWGLSGWLDRHVPALENGWAPRRITPEGGAYPHSPEGGADPIFDHSADGLYLIGLWGRSELKDRAVRMGDAFVTQGGFWGSLNHDTYDDHENVAYAVAFRLLRRMSEPLGRPVWADFAYRVALPAMERFRMTENRHGVWTQGLYWMEESWDTAYLWENAEIAQAHLEAWLERGDPTWRALAVETLDAIAHHHYGDEGFLTEGVDWNNHVGQQHHIDEAEYGAIRYTEPLLNNLHLVGPTVVLLRMEEEVRGSVDR